MRFARSVSLWLAAALLAALLALAPASAQPGSAAKSRQAAGPAGPAGSVVDYWTAARMRAAEPLQAPASGASLPDASGAAAFERGRPLSVAPSAAPREAATAAPEARGGTGVRARRVRNPNQYPNRTHGKVFFRIPGRGDFACSGTAVSSPSRSLVWTAGHCVYAGSGYVRRWVFVPAYRDGRRPFGIWPSRRLAAPEQWRESRNLAYDVGAARVARRSKGTLQRVVGARGIAFGRDVPRRLDAFGYPAVRNRATNQPFDGERPWRCDSRVAGRQDTPGSGPKTIRLGCDMTAGTSGGGWVSPRGELLSSSSYVRKPRTSRRLYGPYLGQVAQALYRRLASRN